MAMTYARNKNLFVLWATGLIVAFALSACAPYQARRHPLNYNAMGEASWYGPGFSGKKTASGERYNQKALTAAHPSLPLGTSLKVTNLNNDKSVVVRINDRGPFVGGRIIDLSKGAAERIGMVGAGTAEVKLEAISAPEDKPSAKMAFASGAKSRGEKDLSEQDDNGETSDLSIDKSGVAALISSDAATADEDVSVPDFAKNPAKKSPKKSVKKPAQSAISDVETRETKSDDEEF